MANVDNPEKTRRMAHAASAGRSVICKVLLLDGTTYDIDVDKKAIGLVLYDKVCTHLDLLEKDYFGLNFIDMKTNLTSWLNLEKRISKQMKNHAWHFNFEVKFYPTDVHQLHEDLTRYQLCLQIRRDIVSEKLPCSFVTYSLLGSYTVQSELGDWEMEEFGPGIDYIKDMRFAPSQDRDLLKKIVELHKTHKGQTPEEAELHFLDNAKKLALYGVDLHDAKDGEGVDIQIGVCAGGIMIYKDKLQISRFVWPKVVKMSYRRNKFYIKLRPGEFEDFQSMIAFKLLSIRHAKRIWKISVEHHSFFRFKEAEMPRKRGLLKLGSKFRYSGRTLYQSKMVVSAVDRPMPNFDRIHSKRATYGGRPNKRPVDDYYSRPIREPRTPPSKPPKPPKPEVPQEHYIDRHPEDNVPHFDRNQPDHEEYEDDDPIETKHRMEKMHAVPTPLALITQNKDKDKDQKENNNGQPQNMESGDEHTPEPRRVNRRDDYRPDSEDEMVRKRIIGRRDRYGKGRQPIYGFGTNQKPVQHALTLSDNHMSKSLNSNLPTRKNVSFREDLKDTELAARKRLRQKVRSQSKHKSASLHNPRESSNFKDASKNHAKNMELPTKRNISKLSPLLNVRSSQPIVKDFDECFSREEIKSRSNSSDSIFNKQEKSGSADTFVKTGKLNSQSAHNLGYRSNRHSTAYEYSSQSDSCESLKINNKESVPGKSITLTNSGYNSFREGVQKNIRRQSSTNSLKNVEKKSFSASNSLIENNPAITMEEDVFDSCQNEAILLEKYMIMKRENQRNLSTSDNGETNSSCDILDLSFSEDLSLLNSSITSYGSINSHGRKTRIKTNGSFNRSSKMEKCSEDLTSCLEKSWPLTSNLDKHNEDFSSRLARSELDLNDRGSSQGTRTRNSQSSSLERIKIRTSFRTSTSAQNIEKYNTGSQNKTQQEKLDTAKKTDVIYKSVSSNSHEPTFELERYSREPQTKFKSENYELEPRRTGRTKSWPDKILSDSRNKQNLLRNSLQNDVHIGLDIDMNDSGICESNLDSVRNQSNMMQQTGSLKQDTSTNTARTIKMRTNVENYDNDLYNRNQNKMADDSNNECQITVLEKKPQNVRTRLNEAKYTNSEQHGVSESYIDDNNSEQHGVSESYIDDNNSEQHGVSESYIDDNNSEQHGVSESYIDDNTHSSGACSNSFQTRHGRVEVPSHGGRPLEQNYKKVESSGLSSSLSETAESEQVKKSDHLTASSARNGSGQGIKPRKSSSKPQSKTTVNADPPLQQLPRNSIARTPSFRLHLNRDVQRQYIPEDVHIITQFIITLVICAISFLYLFYELA